MPDSHEVTNIATRPRAVVATTAPQTLNAFFAELVRQLSATYEVHLVTGPGPEVDALAAELGVSSHSIRMARDISLRRDLAGLWSWWRLMRRLQPDALVAATPKAGLLGMLAARLAGVPRRVYLLVGLRLEGTHGLKRAVLTCVEWVTCTCATRVVTNSRSLRHSVSRLFPGLAGKISTTTPGSSHGVDAEHFAPRSPDAALRSSLGIAPDRLVVGFVGRLTHDKGMDSLIEATRVLASEGARIHLLVVGPQDEPDSQGYVVRLSQAGLPVTVTGPVSDVRPYFALMDVHVLPSLREGFPNVVLEASAMSLPTVTTNATGCVDSVEHGRTGLIVPAGDASALATALSLLLDDAALRRSLGAAARAWVAEHFRPADVTRDVITLAGLRGASE